MNNETLCQWLAFRLPRALVLWCYVRVMAHAALIHSDTEVGNITYTQAFKAWEASDE